MTNENDEAIPQSNRTPSGGGGGGQASSLATLESRLVGVKKFGEVKHRTAELRVGHNDENGNFVNPTIFIINVGAEQKCRLVCKA